MIFKFIYPYIIFIIKHSSVLWKILIDTSMLIIDDNRSGRVGSQNTIYNIYNIIKYAVYYIIIISILQPSYYIFWFIQIEPKESFLILKVIFYLPYYIILGTEYIWTNIDIRCHIYILCKRLLYIVSTHNIIIVY